MRVIPPPFTLGLFNCGGARVGVPGFPEPVERKPSLDPEMDAKIAALEEAIVIAEVVLAEWEDMTPAERKAELGVLRRLLYGAIAAVGLAALGGIAFEAIETAAIIYKYGSIARWIWITEDQFKVMIPFILNPPSDKPAEFKWWGRDMLSEIFKLKNELANMKNNLAGYLERTNPMSYFTELSKVTSRTGRLERMISDAKKDIAQMRKEYPTQGFTQREIEQAVAEYKKDLSKDAAKAYNEIQNLISGIGGKYKPVHGLSREEYVAWGRRYVAGQIPNLADWL